MHFDSPPDRQGAFDPQPELTDPNWLSPLGIAPSCQSQSPEDDFSELDDEDFDDDFDDDFEGEFDDEDEDFSEFEEEEDETTEQVSRHSEALPGHDDELADDQAPDELVEDELPFEDEDLQ